MHSGAILKPKTSASILDQAGVTVDEFLAVLDTGCNGLGRDGIYLLFGTGAGWFQPTNGQFVTGSNSSGHCIDAEAMADINRVATSTDPQQPLRCRPQPHLGP